MRKATFPGHSDQRPLPGVLYYKEGELEVRGVVFGGLQEAGSGTAAQPWLSDSTCFTSSSALPPPHALPATP